MTQCKNCLAYYEPEGYTHLCPPFLRSGVEKHRESSNASKSMPLTPVEGSQDEKHPTGPAIQKNRITEELQRELQERFPGISVYNEETDTWGTSDLVQFILSREEKQKQRMKEKVGQMRVEETEREITGLGETFTDGQEYNQALDDILALLEE